MLSFCRSHTAKAAELDVTSNASMYMYSAMYSNLYQIEKALPFLMLFDQVRRCDGE